MSFLSKAKSAAGYATGITPLVNLGKAVVNGDGSAAAKAIVDPYNISGAVSGSGLANTLGLSAPDLAKTQEDAQYMRDLRGQYLNEYGALTPTAYDATTAQRAAMTSANSAQMGNAAQMSAATVGAAPQVSAPNLAEREYASGQDVTGAQIGPTERAAAANAMAYELAPAQRAQAEQAFSAQIANTRDATSATIDPAAQSRMERVGFTTIDPATRINSSNFDAAKLDTTAANESRGVQGEAIAATRDALSGKAPSVAEMQLKNSTNAAIARQQSIQAGARGLSMAGARRQFAQNASRLEADQAQSGALLRAQEISAARGQLGSLGTDVRGQDIGQSTTQAGLKQDASKFNASADQSANQFNATADNTRALAGAAMSQDVNKTNAAQTAATSQFNAGAQNTRALAQAGMDTDVSKLNVSMANARDTEQARLNTGISQFNAGSNTATSQFNANAQNAVNLAQGQLSTGVSQSNAGLNTGVSQFNAGQTNQAQTDQAKMNNDVWTGNANRDAQISTFNAGQGNTRAIAAGEMQLSADTGNANRTTDVNKTNAGFQQDAGQFNAGAVNTRTQAQAAQDTGVSQSNANLYTNNSQFNAGQTNTTATNNADRGLQADTLDANKASQLRGDVLSAADSVNDTNAGITATEEAAKKRRTDIVSDLGKSATHLVAASDERLKKNIRSVPDADVRAFLDSIDPKEFDYKQGTGANTDTRRHSGVMAQDIETTKMGKGFVLDTPEGKVLDAGDAIGPMLVALKHLNERLDKFQGTRREAAKEMR